MKARHFLQKHSLLSFLLIWVILFILSILFRLPHFLSDNFFFDGDEAIVGIMAQDFLEGKHFPLYFYGQNYGLSTLEVLSTSIFVKLFGSGIWALRLGGLFLFSLGITFIWKTFAEKKKSLFLMILIVLLVLMFPSWYLWGAMVRGGYVSAFVAIAALFYITQCRNVSKTSVLLLSIISAIAFESHQLLLIPILPYVLTWFLKKGNGIKNGIIYLGLSVGTVFLFRWMNINDAVWGSPSLKWGLESQWNNLSTQFDGWLSGYSNFFFFTVDFKIPLWWGVLLIASLVLMGIIIFISLRKSELKIRKTALLVIVALFVNVLLLSTVSLYSPRYWIGVYTGILFLLIYLALHSEGIKMMKAYLALLVGIVLMGVFSAAGMKRDWYELQGNELQALHSVYQKVKQEKIKALYVTEHDLQWKWNYLYGKEVPATFFSEQERINTFKNRVEKIYRRDARKIGVIGLQGIFNGLEQSEEFNAGKEQIAVKYYLLPSATDSIIELGYKTMR